MIATLYRPRDSALHRYDPRCKLINLLTLVVVFFLPLRLSHLAAYLACAALLIGVFLGVRELWPPVRTILPILILVLVLTPPFHRQGTPLFGEFVLLTDRGLAEALRLVMRFTGVTLLFFVYLRTTDPERVVLALRWFGLPFGAALVISIALQYIPNFKVLYGQVRDAHRLRQAAPSAGQGPVSPKRPGLFGRLANSIPALTSVLILSVRRIPVLAMVLESRGVGRSNRRTSWQSLPSGRKVLPSWLLCLAVEAAAIAPVFLFP
ncbi:MAG: energy-coupling factor transporter transmembrane protein EcfT [Spirochaetales bacterium]|nr:energy-coupling factor transporter transmembrane protein EcfT [Spirochaetales bacterium]